MKTVKAMAMNGDRNPDGVAGTVFGDEVLIDPEPFRELYIHLPFCVSRCAYCDFSTEARPCDDATIDRYVEDLCLTIRRAAKAGRLARVKTVYLGGGTPSHLGLSRLSLLLYTLSLSMHLTPEVECTMEANPESLTPSMVKDIWALGVNRLSIGVQSFDDEVLAFLGRAHDAEGARRAIACARARFENVSVDLICGIPGQSTACLRASVREAIEAGVTHISVYPLTVEEGTPLAARIEAGECANVDDDVAATHMEEAAALLTEAGFARYEVASYAKPGFACRHNIGYWSGVPYLGLGTSAVTMAQNAVERVRFCDGSVVEELNAAQMVAEDLMLGMRKADGVSKDLIERAASLLPDTQTTVSDAIALGLARWDGERLVPTERGWLCGNELYGRFYDLAPSL